MGYSRTSTLLLVALLVGYLEDTNAYPLDPNVAAALQPPWDFFTTTFFNTWARYILTGIGFSFLTASGVILAIKRMENKLANLEDYYDQLQEYLSEGPEFFPEDFPDEFPIPTKLPTHNFPFPPELPGPGGWFASYLLRPQNDLEYPDLDPPVYVDDTARRGPPVGNLRRRKRSVKPSPAPPELQEAMQRVLQAEDTQEMVMTTAKLVHDVVGRLDEDGCLVKLLCHLQEKANSTRTLEQEVLLTLYTLNVPPEGPPACGQSKCPLEEALLEEAFQWGVDN